MTERSSGTRVVLLAAGNHGHRAVERMIEHHPGRVVGIFSYRVEPPQEHFLDDIRSLAERNRIPFWEGSDVAAARFGDVWQRLAPDLVFAIKWRRMIPTSVITHARGNVLVFHAGLLPKYRGFAPIPWALINGEKRSGVTLFYAAPEVDSGDIVDQREFTITEDDDAGTLDEKVAQTVAAMLVDTLPSLQVGTAPRRKQDEREATYCIWRSPEDGEIDWRWPARRLHDFVRALTSPFPGAFTRLEGRKLTIWKSRVDQTERRYVGSLSGKIERIEPGRGVSVLAGDGIVWAVDVQLDGQERRPAWEVIQKLKTRLGP